MADRSHPWRHKPHCWVSFSVACTVKPVLNCHSKEDKREDFQDWISLNAGQKYCRMLQGSILQYFRPALSYHLSLRPSFYLFLSGRLRQVWLYVLVTKSFYIVCWYIFSSVECIYFYIHANWVKAMNWNYSLRYLAYKFLGYNLFRLFMADQKVRQWRLTEFRFFWAQENVIFKVHFEFIFHLHFTHPYMKDSCTRIYL